MEHSYETGVNKKMVFFRMLHSDFSRMIKSWKFYLAIAFIAVLTFLSIYPEAAGSGGNCSVYYLVNARGGVSPFCIPTRVLSGDEYNSCRIAVRAQLLGGCAEKLYQLYFTAGT